MRDVQVGDIIGQLRIDAIRADKAKCTCLCGNTVYISINKLANEEVEHCGCRDRLKNDLSGKEFGNWKVIGYLGNQRYACKCGICGKIESVHGQELQLGRTTKCKKCAAKSLSNDEDILGRVVGNWQILESIDSRHIKAKCLLCNNERIVGKYDVLNGNSTSCGCNSTRKKEYEGKRFKSYIAKSYNKGYWLCECVYCGKQKEIRTMYLTKGNFADCSCQTNKEIVKRDIKAGIVIGDFQLINRLDISYTKWECKCVKCGDIQYKDVYNMLKGVGNKCSKCKEYSDNYDKHKAGEVYGDFETIEYLSDRHGYWLCRCKNCGCEVEKHLQSLKKGIGDRCTKCNMPKKMKYHPGYVFGDFRLKERAYDIGSDWICECVNCGNEEIKNTKSLHKGIGTKCRICNPIEYNYKDFRGMRFGWMEPLNYIQGGKWECKCHLCGNTKVVSAGNLVNGHVKSCGCLSSFKWEQYYKNDPLVGKIIDCWRIDNRAENRQKYDCTCIKCGRKDSIYIDSIKKGYSKECATCNPQYGSQYEKEIANMFKGASLNDRDALGGMELDLYYKDKSFAIEFNGSYWHNDNIKDRNYHKNKTLRCLNKGIRLIHIFDYEWFSDSTKLKLIKLIESCICNNSKIVYARNTEVKEISFAEAKEFLIKYHLQNSATSSINIGLFDCNELIGVMTFNTPRFDNEAEYELVRLAYKNNVNVIGGSEKMFKYFLDVYKPASIISYCNIAKFTGAVYERLGFKFIGYTIPNYVWYDLNRNVVLNRYKTTKKKLLEEYDIEDGPEVTEDSIMKSLGFLKIYDCGNAKYLFERT